MIRESLWNLKTHDGINTADDIPRVKNIRTLSNLSGIEENTPVKQDQKALEMALVHDRQRLARQLQAVERSQQRLLAMRSKLKATKLWNQRIQEQRGQIMKQRRGKLHSHLQAATKPATQPTREIPTAVRSFGLIVTY